jgi:hypothetical protein
MPVFLSQEGAFERGDAVARVLGIERERVRVRWLAGQGFRQPRDSWIGRREAVEGCPAAFCRFVLMNLD